MFEFESGIVLFYFSFIFISFGESRLFVSWCAGDICGMVCSNEEIWLPPVWACFSISLPSPLLDFWLPPVLNLVDFVLRSSVQASGDSPLLVFHPRAPLNLSFLWCISCCLHGPHLGSVFQATGSLCQERVVCFSRESIPAQAFLLLSFLLMLHFVVRSSESVWTPDLFLPAWFSPFSRRLYWVLIGCGKISSFLVFGSLLSPSVRLFC
jgi:hypothetical protein